MIASPNTISAMLKSRFGKPPSPSPSVLCDLIRKLCAGLPQGGALDCRRWGAWLVGRTLEFGKPPIPDRHLASGKPVSTGSSEPWKGPEDYKPPATDSWEPQRASVHRHDPDGLNGKGLNVGSVLISPRLRPNTPRCQGKARSATLAPPIGAWLLAISPRWKRSGPASRT